METKQLKLAALALIRASIEGDTESIAVLVVDNPPSHDLTAQLVALTAGMLTSTLGDEQACAAIDRWMRSLLAAQ